MSFMQSRRNKTMSESSDSAEYPALKDAEVPAMGVSPNNNPMETKYLYDIDGKFPYSVYEKKPQLYDIDGKTTYKYFNQLKHLNNGQVQQMPSHVYDLDGKFSYTVYNPAEHRARFSAKAPGPA